MNIFTILDMAADAFPDRHALTTANTSLTFETLRNAARGAARLPQATEERIAFLDVAGPAASIALYGAALSGRAYVPLNWRLTQGEQQALLARVAPALLVAGTHYTEGMEIPPGIRVMTTEAFLHAASELGEQDALPTPEDERATAVALFTSGTTGAPKSALLRHGNLMAYILGSLEFGSADEHEAALVSVPPYHVAGISAVLSNTYTARHTVLLPAFDAAAWLDLATKHAVTTAFVVPTMLARIVEHLETQNQPPPPSLRALAYGGGKMPPGIIARAMKLLPDVDFTNAYGLTETSSTITLLAPNDHREAAASTDPAITRRLNSVGRALPAVELQIRDESGAPLPAETAGLVFVRGDQVAGEYQGLGSLLDPDGWFPTRDRGFLDAEGYLFLDGRADDVIVRGGENISPGEIEAVLIAHEAVADAAVVAIPDETWGEAIAAAVVLKPNAAIAPEELQDWVRDRLRSSRTPQQISFYGSLPVNDLGKVLRRVIRDQLAGKP
jgi:acyl-CoA synthetase (AMP-forming)/AMP-acid ligase II